ncbi:MAG: roadblock/LC7 domain-containing protein [Truepera sp.]|nr:roadblock/LC7 domain-containing protein [Truepera sp.]
MQLAELLNQLLEIRGVTSAAVVRGDGELLKQVSPHRDIAFVTGLLASSLASSRVLAGLLGDGEISQIMLEYEEGPVLLTPLPTDQTQDEGYLLVVTLDAVGNLGRARFQLRKLLPNIVAALAA